MGIEKSRENEVEMVTIGRKIKLENNGCFKNYEKKCDQIYSKKTAGTLHTWNLEKPVLLITVVIFLSRVVRIQQKDIK